MNTLILKQGEKKISGLLFISMIIMIALLNSCGGNEPGGGTDDKKGPPYKFRIEISAEKPDEFKIGYGVGSYNYLDDNKVPRTIWFTPDVLEKVSSPCIKEIEVPSNFTKFMLTVNLHSIDILMPLEKEMAEKITGKIFINNKLLVEFSNKYWWIITIGYDEKSKKYEVKTSDGKVFEKTKLD